MEEIVKKKEEPESPLVIESAKRTQSPSPKEKERDDFSTSIISTFGRKHNIISNDQLSALKSVSEEDRNNIPIEDLEAYLSIEVTSPSNDLQQQEEAKPFFEEIEKLFLKPIKKLKISRPMILLSFGLLKIINKEIKYLKDKDGQNFYEDKENNDIFRNFTVTWWQNLCLSKIVKELDNEPELFDVIFPKLKEVAVLTTGKSFGDIAQLEHCARTATIYCDQEVELAIITKKDFLRFSALLDGGKTDMKKFLKKFDIFNWWQRRKSLLHITPYMIKREKGIGEYLYKPGKDYF